MKKLIALILSLVLVLTAVSAFAEPYRIAIVQHLSHTSLNQIRDTIEKALSENEDIELIIKNAEGDLTALPVIFNELRASGIDMLIPIATPTAKAAKTVFEDDDMPIVFAAVADPVAAGMTGEGCENITGVSNNIPAAEIVKLIFNFQPDCKKIGFVYTSSEDNSVSTHKAAMAYCDAEGIAYEEKTIAALNELPLAVQTLLEKGVDALFTGNDNTIASAMATYTDLAYEAGVPIYCGADSMVADGGFATTGVNYVQLGEQVAAMALRIKNGQTVAENPYEVLKDYARFVNMQAVDRFGGDFAEAAYEGFNVLVEADGTSHFNK